MDLHERHRSVLLWFWAMKFCSLFRTVVCCLNSCAKQIVARECATVKIWSQRRKISERYQDVKVLFEEIYDLMVLCCQPHGCLVTRNNNQCWVETSKISYHCRFYCTILHCSQDDWTLLEAPPRTLHLLNGQLILWGIFSLTKCLLLAANSVHSNHRIN